MQRDGGMKVYQRPGSLSMSDKVLMSTITGDHFQPVRLHYHVHDQQQLLAALRKLRCLDDDRPRKRWVWLLEHEARDLPFKVHYSQIPSHLRPIIIGSIYLRPQGSMLLDLRSCERALLAIPFFDQHIPREVARVTQGEIVTQLFSTENPKLSPEDLFDGRVSTGIDRIPIHYYEDGIGGFQLAVRVRQIVATQHWLGNTRFTMMDAIRQVAPG